MSYGTIPSTNYIWEFVLSNQRDIVDMVRKFTYRERQISFTRKTEIVLRPYDVIREISKEINHHEDGHFICYEILIKDTCHQITHFFVHDFGGEKKTRSQTFLFMYFVTKLKVSWDWLVKVRFIWRCYCIFIQYFFVRENVHCIRVWLSSAVPIKEKMLSNSWY